MAEPPPALEEARLAAIRAALEELQAEYAQELPGLIAELVQATTAACSSRSETDLRHLQTLAHRMHGAAGSYGFKPVSVAAAKMEELLATRQESLAPFDEALQGEVRIALSAVQAAARSELERLGAK